VVATHRHGAARHLFLAHDGQHRDLPGGAVADLLVEGVRRVVDLDAHEVRKEPLAQPVGVLEGVVADREDADLDRRHPERERSREVLDEEGDEEDAGLETEEVEEILEGLKSSDLRDGLNDEIKAHARQQYSILVKKLISKGCPEDVSNYFTDNLFELKSEAGNLIALVDRLVSTDEDFENLIFEIEEVLVEISIPWVGFSPGETAHALWHMGDHDEDNFFFMGFLGWSLAVLENLQDNTEDLK